MFKNSSNASREGILVTVGRQIIRLSRSLFRDRRAAESISGEEREMSGSMGTDRNLVMISKSATNSPGYCVRERSFFTSGVYEQHRSFRPNLSLLSVLLLTLVFPPMRPF